MPKVEFRPSEDNSIIEMLISPDPPGEYDPEPISAERLLALFQASPYAAYFPLENSFEGAADKWQELGPDDTMPAWVVAESRNALLMVKIADDELSASATITAAYSGMSIRSIDVIVAARKAGISEGLDVKAVGRLVAEAHNLASGERLTEVIAHGRPPTPGVDAVFQQLVETLEDRATQPVETKDGYVDVKNYGAFVSVAKGTALMRKIPATPGVSGMSVTGKVLPAPKVWNPRLTAGKGAIYSPDGDSLLLAERDGLPRRLPTGMGVDDVLHLKAVNLASGNVDFDGSVIVERDVHEDMRVQVSGDVVVGGLVESAVIEAGGSVFIGKGIIGRQIDDKEAQAHNPDSVQYAMVVRAGGDIRSKYAQSCELTSGKSIFLDKYLYHSRVLAEEQLWIGSSGKGGRANGKLIGGFIQVGSAVQAGHIGMPSGALGIIDLSLQVQREEEKLRQMEEKMERIGKEEKQLRDIFIAQKNGKTRYPEEKLVPLKAKHEELVASMVALKGEMLAQQTRIEMAFEKVRVVATSTLYPGITVRLRDKNLKITTEHNACEVGMGLADIGIWAIGSNPRG
jgi:uncharacterized protein (DUF342 family)